MIKKGAEIFDYKEELKNRYGYSEEFAESLTLLADDMVDYLGEEYANVVYDTILSTEYLIAGQKKKSKVYESPIDVLDRIGLLDGITSPQKDELPRTNQDGISIDTPRIELKDGSFTITGTRRVIVLPHNFNNESISSIRELFKTTLEAIKASLNEYEIDGKLLTIKSGLQVQNRTLSNKNGDLTSTVSNTIGEGLEKATTSYDELCFMRQYHDSNYDVKGDSSLTVLAGYLYDNLQLRDTIRVASVTKDYSVLKETIEKTTSLDYDTFMSQIDALERLEKEIQRSVLDTEALNKAIRNRDDYFTTVVAPSIQEMNSVLMKEETLKDGYKKS